MLEQYVSKLTVQTCGRGLLEITREVAGCVEQSGIEQGLLTLFVRHTSASLLIQENADPDVGIYLWEHRLRGHSRELALHVLGEPGRR